MTVREAAARLEVSDKLVYQLCARGLLAHHRIGTGRGAIRIDPADLETYLASRRVEATGDAPRPARVAPPPRRRTAKWTPRYS